MIRRHAMPFGAQVEDAGTRFRLWAPDAGSVELVVLGRSPESMTRDAEGWAELVLADVGPGARYQYRIDGKLLVPDPASRRQPDDVHAPSEVVDPAAFDWQDGDWRGRPWDETVLYELHVGTFSPEGSFAGVEARLDYLAALGVTAVELMPLADFTGRRGWGYDGVLPFAPDSAYGSPDDLKRLVQAAHGRGLMVFLDVVYNHFGPDGNYLNAYAKRFFTEAHHTPWGAANNFDGPGSAVVRDFFIHNAVYWLEEFHFDGLRLDAVHAIIDDSPKPFLVELAERVRAALPDRHVHLVVENDANAARLLSRRLFDAQWNDDLHHILHLLLTGETGGYYRDYRDDPLRHLGRSLTEGFAYQGEVSEHRRGEPRGEPSGHLPPARFVGFLQNHDQIGNRAMGERLDALASTAALEAGLAVLLLAPAIPLLFMGEEWGASTPFLYFCDFHDQLAKAVRDGRRREFAGFPAFSDPKARARIPDPNADETFSTSVLNWDEAAQPPHAGRLALVRQLLALRRREIVPRLPGMAAESGFDIPQPGLLQAWWRLGDGTTLQLHANLSGTVVQVTGLPEGRIIHTNHGGFAAQGGQGNNLPPWTVTWLLSGETT